MRRIVLVVALLFGLAGLAVLVYAGLALQSFLDHYPFGFVSHL